MTHAGGCHMDEIQHFWPTPWLFEEEGYNGGPCIKDAKGQIICAFFWPGHPTEETGRAEAAMTKLGESVGHLGNRTA